MISLRHCCLVPAALALILAGCGSKRPYQINFMPAPDVYSEDIVNPFADFSPIEIDDGDAGILYLTNRAPDPDADGTAYTGKRGHVVRSGVAQVELGEGDYTWEEARRISLLKNRTEDYPLKVSSITEFGVVPNTISPIDDPADYNATDFAVDEMVRRIQVHLDRSKLKDVTIYVHGYKVVFENPILVSAELWHYLGYEGSFIAFAWPATPKTLAYFADSATAEYSAWALRQMITEISSRTTAENINIIGYSAGTRIVVTALDQLNLLAKFVTPEIKQKYLRIGSVILVGADADRDNFTRIVGEGVLDIVDDFNIYISEKDKALGMSRWLLAGQNRLGQMLPRDQWTDAGMAFLAANPRLRVINVTEAEGSKSANGHGYFRASPWVSGDILMTLRYGLSPAERGLVMHPEVAAWEFPPDYLERLRFALQDVTDPDRVAAAE
ncbi:MAG: alpha/beta hydrolase [Gammaproteobacteria bacterium]|nr:alpha/beta hydrolase [Gammaproteobacteria bacterium]